MDVDKIREDLEIESELVSLRQIYETLSTARKKLLEDLLKHYLVCHHLLANLLPAGCVNVITLDFNSYRSQATEEIQQNHPRWKTGMIQLFASPKPILVSLPQAYLAVREWNCGRFYTPEHPSEPFGDPNYPVRPTDVEGGVNETIKRLVAMANEPLKVLGDMEEVPTPAEESSYDPPLALVESVC